MRKILVLLTLTGITSLTACSQSTPEFRRMVQITTDSMPVQCMLREGQTSVMLLSTPGSVPVPYSIENPLIECTGAGLYGKTTAHIPHWRTAQTVFVHMSSTR